MEDWYPTMDVTFTAAAATKAHRLLMEAATELDHAADQMDRTGEARHLRALATQTHLLASSLQARCWALNDRAQLPSSVRSGEATD